MRQLLAVTSLFVLLAALVLSVEGCATAPTPTPAPTVDVAAVQTQAAVAIFATQTASVPTVTAIPPDTATLAATNTPRTTNTPQPSATSTPRPSATPLPTAVIPEGWSPYTAITERFSLARPAEWALHDEKPESVLFQVSSFSNVGVGFDSFAFSEIPENDVNTWFEYIAKSERDTISTPKKGAWDDGVHSGAFVEYASFDDIYDVWGYHITIGFPTSKGTIFLLYYRAGTKTETDAVRDTLKQLSATIRVKE